MIYPHATSRRIVLQPATAQDSALFLKTLLRTGLESFRPAASAVGMFRILNAAFLVTHRHSRMVLGFSTLHGLDPAGHIRCGIYLDPQKARLGVGAEATQLLINYAFASFNVDRVIAQTTEASFSAFGLTVDGELEREVLPEHLYFRGQLWDLHTFQMRRSDWEAHIERTPGGILPEPLDWRTAPH